MKNVRRVLSVILAVVLCAACFTACGNGGSDDTTAASGANTEATGIAAAKSVADLKGMKIAAQTGTFHADALKQIEDVQSSTLPDFTELLSAVKSGTIDGYIAEEPTAISACRMNSDLDYLHLKNNDTGFTATAADVGIAIGLKKGSDLLEKMNEVIKGITEEQKEQLMEQIIAVKAGDTVEKFALESEAPENPTGTLKVAMECAYEPYNWTETSSDTRTLGAVAISGEGKEGQYANGYDVQVAQYVANKLGLKLEIYSYDWDSLIPALNSGAVDAIVAGMSPTAERKEQIDFTDTYYESNLVVIYKK
ncbi:MAG: transporter substrate-binding domain-containing protein [Clostridia bacterium]|nr:transporter substrate-binding domain-containing protein [Clostridia bacterium]